MTTIQSTELKKGAVFKENGTVYLVLDYKHVKKGRGLATVRVKVRDVESGATVEKTFSSNEKTESADLSYKSAQYLYSDNEFSTFMDSTDYSQFLIKKRLIENQLLFLIDGAKVKVLWMEEKAIGIEIAKKVELKVKYTEPAVQGDTATAATKEAELETGLKIQVPLFIKTGDIIIVNTESREYVSKG